MNVIEKTNQILKKAGISKVNLSKYLGVSRQMVYNYLDGDDLSKFPTEKCKLLFNLLNVNSEEELKKIELTNEYISEVSNKIFDTSGNKGSKEAKKELVDLTGLSHEDALIISDIAIMLKNILIEGKGRAEENSATIE